jgi:two-component system, chemotaxis family, response regulator Rcp1
MRDKTIHVLMVEDDAGDVQLTKEALKDSKLVMDLVVVDDGEKALRLLRRQAPYEDAQRPDLVILDLNLPRVDGRQVLREVKGDPALKQIPIVVVTTSDAEADIEKSYGLGANCYVTKPIGLDQFLKVVRSIEDFWMTVVKLPPRPA